MPVVAAKAATTTEKYVGESQFLSLMLWVDAQTSLDLIWEQQQLTATLIGDKWTCTATIDVIDSIITTTTANAVTATSAIATADFDIGDYRCWLLLLATASPLATIAASDSAATDSFIETIAAATTTWIDNNDKNEDAMYVKYFSTESLWYLGYLCATVGDDWWELTRHCYCCCYW